MIITLTAGSTHLRLLTISESGREKLYRFPIGMLAETSARQRAVGEVAPLFKQAWVVFTCGQAPGFEPFIETLAPYLPRRPQPLDLMGGCVEWGFTPPQNLPIERMLALTAAASLWPQWELVLVDLMGGPAFEILQHATHLASFQPTGFEHLLATHFPQRPPLLVHKHLRPAAMGQNSLELARDIQIEGIVAAWRAHITKLYLKKGETLFISYGEDEAGLRVFPGVSDKHCIGLTETGARLLALAQWGKINRSA